MTPATAWRSRQSCVPGLARSVSLSVLACALVAAPPGARAQGTKPAPRTKAPAATAPAAPSPAAAAAAVDPATAAGWTNLRVPGGIGALLSAADLSPSRPRATALLDIIYTIHDVREGILPASDARRTRLLDYLATVAEFDRARAPFRTTAARLAGATNKPTRKTLEVLAAAMGASLDEERKVYRMVPRTGGRDQQRRTWLKAAGVDVDALETSLNAGEAVSLAMPEDAVPLPLPESLWRSLLASARFPDMPVGAILADRKAALLYVGLCSMDAETRRYLVATPALVKEVYDSDRSGVIALYGRSLHVRGGRIEPPGGARAAALWEAIADEKVVQPDRFVLKVLGKDSGRLALVYDAIAHMDAAGQAYTLGTWIDGTDLRLDRFKALYATCGLGLAGWEPAARPFARGLDDPAHLLLLSATAADGRPAPLALRKLWSKAFDGDSLPDRPENDLKDVDKDGLLDASGMLELIMAGDNRQRRDASLTWSFGQRVFARATRAELPHVLVALRGYHRFRALGATLDRLGLTDPAVYAAAFRRAQAVASIGDRDRAATALALYQGGLVLVERARLSRVLDVASTGRLVASLGRVAMSDDGEFMGGVASWLDTEYLPAIGSVAGMPAGTGDGPSIEGRVLEALAGRRGGSAPVPGRVFDYEGTLYRADPSAPELARLRAVREKQGGVSLDAVMAYTREVQTIASGIPDLARVPARVAGLKAAAAALLAQSPDARAWPAVSELREAVADAVGDLGKMRKPKDLAKAERLAVPLRRLADRYMARVLLSLAYAAALFDAESTALVSGDPSAAHDWGLREVDARSRLRAAWNVPEESHDGGRWLVRGSVLALDLAFGSQALHRISSDALPGPPTITESNRRAFTEAVVLANAFDYRDDDMARLADALRRGRSRVAVLASVPELLAEVAQAADLDDTRGQLLAWALVHERPRVPEFFSLGDLVRLGRLERESVGGLDAWGTSGYSFDGRLCLRYPDSQPFATLAGRRATGLLASLVSDLPLLVAETLSDQRLPAALTRSILSAATQDYVDRVSTAYEDDWLTLFADVQRTVPAHMDDYLASVTTGGPLVPIQKKAEGGRD
jgi:hypothetical protein